MCVESDDLKECLDINLEKVEWLEKEFKEWNMDVEDFLVEVYVKFNVVCKMKVMNSGEYFVELLLLEFMVKEDEEGVDGGDVCLVILMNILMKDVVIFFYEVCFLFFNDNRGF